MSSKNYWTLVLPVIFITAFYYLSKSIDKSLNLPKIPININLITYVLILVGTILVISVFYFFITFGKGTPVPKQLTNKLITKKLVVKGPFKYTRNPMAIGFFLILFGMAFYYKSYSLLFLTAIMAIIGHLFIVHIEEKDMEQRFGKSYLEYKKKVPRWMLKFHS